MTPEERALLADLKMYDQADKTRVRDHEFKHIDDKRTPEIGPVDENLKLEEPDYEIPWSGKIDENKKVLGNAKDLAKISMGDFSDSYLPEEAQRVAELATMVDPTVLGEKAILFPSVALEKAFWKKYFKGNKRRVDEIMRNTDKARDNMSTAAQMAIDEGHEPTFGTRGGIGIHPQLDSRFAPTSVEYSISGVDVGNGGRVGTASHELTHLYHNYLGKQEGTKIPNGDLAGLTHGRVPEGEYPVSIEGTVNYAAAPGNDDKMYTILNNMPVVKGLREKFAAMPVKDRPKSREELSAFIAGELNKDPLYKRAVEANDGSAMEIELVIEDLLESDRKGPFQTPSGGRINGSHKRQYAKESELVGENANVMEGTAGTTALFSNPNSGRWMKANGVNNENFVFPIRLDDSSIDKDKLFKELEASDYYDEADDLVPVKSWKFNYGGPKYKEAILKEVDAEKPAGRSHTSEWNTEVVPETGDRYGNIPWGMIEEDYKKLKALTPEERAKLFAK